MFDLSKNYFIKYLKKIFLFLIILFGKYDIIHSHSTDYKVNKIIKALKRIKKYKIYFTNHNPRLFDNPKKTVDFFNKYISNLDYLILVSQTIYDVYKKNGVCFPSNVLIKNAYLPPDKSEENKILTNYSKAVYKFLSNGHPLIIANASVVMFKDGIDLYGLDMCVELTVRLKKKYPRIGFIFALANESRYRGYLQEIKEKIQRDGISGNFTFLSGQQQIWPLFSMVNLMIRPTYSDGYAFSIDEAVERGCKVIASDVCDRHPKAILFKTRYMDDLEEKVLNILK